MLNQRKKYKDITQIRSIHSLNNKVHKICHLHKIFKTFMKRACKRLRERIRLNNFNKRKSFK